MPRKGARSPVLKDASKPHRNVWFTLTYGADGSGTAHIVETLGDIARYLLKNKKGANYG